MGLMYKARPRTPGLPPDEGFQERDPQQHLRGNVFPAARQARAITGAIWWGDAGAEENEYRGTHPRYPDGGRDTVADGGPREQGSAAYGMGDAYDSFRYRFLNTLNLGKLIRLQRATVGNGQSDMRPTAEAVNRLTAGYPATPAVSRLPSGRMVAPGRVTRWPMSSLIWQPMGVRNGGNENA